MDFLGANSMEERFDVEYHHEIEWRPDLPVESESESRYSLTHQGRYEPPSQSPDAGDPGSTRSTGAGGRISPCFSDRLVAYQARGRDLSESVSAASADFEGFRRFYGDSHASTPLLSTDENLDPYQLSGSGGSVWYDSIYNLNLLPDDDFGPPGTVVGTHSSRYPGSSPAPGSRTLPSHANTRLGAYDPGENYAAQPWEHTAAVRQEKPPGIENSSFEAYNPPELGFPKDLDAGVGRERPMKTFRPIGLPRRPKNAKRAEPRESRRVVGKHSRERDSNVLQARHDVRAGHVLPENARAKLHNDVPSDDCADVDLARQVCADEPWPLKTLPVYRNPHESTKKAADAKCNALETTSKPPMSPSDIAVELDGDASLSRCQSPWLERWFEEGNTESFQEFGARVAPSGIHTDPLLAHRNKCLDAQDQRGDVDDGNFGEPVQSKTSGAGSGGQVNCSHTPTSLGKRSNEATRNNNCGDGGYNHGDFDDRDDNDGPSQPQRRRITGPTEAEGTPEKFACPCQKIFPLQNHLCGLPHGKRTFYGWNTVSRVKQHVLRSHGKGYHCSHCWKAFSVKPDEGKCKGGKCPSRSQPDKHWLTDAQVVQLETEKIPNTANGWYRLVAILFPEMPEEGEGGYRSSYTPYYCIHWTEPTKELTATVPKNTETDLLPPWDFSADAATEFTSEGANKADAPDCIVPFASPGQLETGSAVQTCFLQDDGASAGPSNILDPDFSWENTLNEPGPAMDDSTRTAENSTADGFRSSAAYTSGSVTNSTPSTDPILPSNPYCSCTMSGTCSHCRLKQRLKRLEAENESFRATIEKARSLVDKHDGVLQDVHDSRRAPDSVMEELWKYQDELRKILSSCRE